jgi:hypothetical protein
MSKTAKDTKNLSESLIAASDALQARFKAEISQHGPALGSRKVEDLLAHLKAYALGHKKMAAISHDLHSFDVERENSALLEALGAFPKALEGIDINQLDDTAARNSALEKARAAVIDQLKGLNQDLEGKIPTIAPKIFPKQLEEDAERSPGVFRRMLSKHNDMMEKQSDAGRLGIAASELVLGGILTNVGIGWLSQSRRGLKEKSIIHTDERGNAVADVMIVPMPQTERVLKAALGTAGLGVGIGGTILGFCGIFRGGSH